MKTIISLMFFGGKYTKKKVRQKLNLIRVRCWLFVSIKKLKGCAKWALMFKYVALPRDQLCWIKDSLRHNWKCISNKKVHSKKEWFSSSYSKSKLSKRVLKSTKIWICWGWDLSCHVTYELNSSCLVVSSSQWETFNRAGYCRKRRK